MSSTLITGGAGFIGFHLQKKLQGKSNVTAIDLLPEGNKAAILRAENLKSLTKGNIHEKFLSELGNKPDVVVHLAPETGIPGSLSNPQKYFKTNIEGTFNVLEECRKNKVQYLIYASSSSVYEPNQKVMTENGATAKQLSFYGTSKKLCETMVENYCKQFGITAIGLRFFTVYRSWTRPDMAAYKFMKAINNENGITLYNNGEVMRDFTHVSDIVNSIERLVGKIKQEPQGSHQVFNIGYGQPSSVLQYAEQIAENLGKKLYFKSEKLPANELVSTHADTSKLEQFIQYKPTCSLYEGIKEMTDWFKKVNYE